MQIHKPVANKPHSRWPMLQLVIHLQQQLPWCPSLRGWSFHNAPSCCSLPQQLGKLFPISLITLFPPVVAVQQAYTCKSSEKSPSCLLQASPMQEAYMLLAQA